MTGIHEGHRERIRASFRESGLEGFAPHEVIELLLCYSIPQRDVNELAHRLINAFGGVSGLMDARYEDLLKVPGVGEYTATLIKLIPALSRRYLTDRADFTGAIRSSSEAGEYLLARFFGLTEETVYLVCLDARNKVLGCDIIDVGGMDSARADIRGIMSAALKYNTSFAILAHNHVGGIALPSEQDTRATRTVADALATIGVELFDHIIVANDDFVSLRESGLL